MTEEETFQPIESQEQLDEIIVDRLNRQRARYDAEVRQLKEQLQAKETEISDTKLEHFRADAKRELVGALAERGITNEGRIERILRFVDFDDIAANEDGSPNRHAIDMQLQSIGEDLPELLPERVQVGSGSGFGSKEPVLVHKPSLTREELEEMSEAEVNARWDEVQEFLAEER
jgi:hypothetical protein